MPVVYRGLPAGAVSVIIHILPTAQGAEQPPAMNGLGWGERAVIRGPQGFQYAKSLNPSWGD